MLAQQEARDLGHEHLGTGHLLLGLVVDERQAPASDAGAVLHGAGVQESTARAVVAEIENTDPSRADRLADDDRVIHGHIPFTTHAKQALELSTRRGLRYGLATVEPGHVLLGLLDQPDSGALRVLLRLNIDLPALSRQTEHVMAATPHPTPEPATHAAGVSTPADGARVNLPRVAH